MRKFQPGYYQHYKGSKYLALGVCKHSETLEDLVVYICLHENKTSQMWVRPLAMFLESVEVEGKKVDRFKFISSN